MTILRALGLGLALTMAACAPDAAETSPPGSDATGSHADAASVDAATGQRPDADPGEGPLELRYTEHLGQLTGTARNPLLPVGMSGTDLGVAFARDGLVAIMFGDAWMDNRDSMAITAAAFPDDGHLPKLTWLSGDNGQFIPFAVPEIDLGAFNVPVEAVPAGDLTYYFFSTGYDFSPDVGRHSHSVLAHGTGLTMSPLVLDHKVASDRFINVSVVVDDGTAWIFGSGAYRKSPVYLARVPLSQIADRDAWRYWPAFSAGEQTAEPIMPIPCVGELSVRRHPALGIWLMAYNCGEPRGIHLRTAPAPEGPWSEPLLVYTPEMGYEHFIHANESVVGHDDGLSDRGRENEWGGEYGPYLVPEWFSSPAPGVFAIVYLMSSWNPYQAHLMRTYLARPGVSWAPPDAGAGLPPATLTNGDFGDGCTAGWEHTGATFVCFTDDDGLIRLTTSTPGQGDAATGTLSQKFAVDDQTHELGFFIHGGDAEVDLVDGDEVIRRSFGRRDNETETEVRWNLEDLRGHTLTVIIDDHLTGPWGFVGARGFELR
ncbi:MAG TPA: DUF4185 domain-containing protein [Kofleriaceae bacterium]|nr:DUF4185 domain-containing protein [Kofleriaceae bacterium]